MSAAPRELPPSPYPGLRPFTEQESRLFCGRTMERLRLLRQLESAHFLAVLGSSGSGKSSLVLSGLLPDIRADRLKLAEGQDMQFAIFRPGRNPFANLASALHATWIGAGLPDAFFIEERLRQSPRELARMVAGPSDEPETRPRCLLIVVDQFEEIFRFANLLPQEREPATEDRHRDFRVLAGDLNEAQAFITLLLTTVVECADRVRVVTTMRSDFFKHCEVFDGLPEVLAAHQFVTPRMSREQMEDAVELPLSYYDCAISEALVNDILNDVPGEFDQLPVLQHALARMWQEAWEREGRQPTELTAEDYRRVGRLAGAMNDHGGELMQPEHPDATRPVLDPAQVGLFFRCLGDFDPTSGQLIRRPRTLAQITAESGLGEAAAHRIAQAFARADASFLQCTPALPADGTPPRGEIIVDLTHECLLRKWDSYKKWMEQERSEGEVLQQVAELMQQFGWDGTKTAGDDHLTPGQLHRMTEARLTTRAPTWAARYQADMAQVDAFLRAEQQHARSQRFRKRVYIGSVVLAVAGGSLAIMSERQKTVQERVSRLESEAKTQRAEEKVKQAQLEAAQAQAEAAELRASQDAYSKQISQTQAQAQQQVVGKVGELEAKVGALSEVVDELRRLPVEKPEDLTKRLAALGFNSGHDPTSNLPKAGAPAASLKLDGFKQLSSVALLAGKEPDTFDLLVGGAALHRLPLGLENGAAVPSGDPSPATTLVSGWKETAGSLTLSRWPDSAGWQLVTNGGPRLGLCRVGSQEWQILDTRAQTRQAGVTRARLLPGQRVVFGTGDGLLGLLDVKAPPSTPAALFKSKHSKPINDVVADPAGKWLVSSGDDGLAALWQIDKGLSLKPRSTVTCGAVVRSASFSPDGLWALLPSGEREIRLYFLARDGAGFGDSEHLLTLAHDDPVVAGAFSPDGRWIATATTKGAINLWHAVPVPLVGDKPLPIGSFNNGARVSALAWSPDSTLLAAGDRTGNTIVWRLNIGETVAGEPQVMPKAAGTVDALAWSPKGELLAVGDTQGTVQVHAAGRFRQTAKPPTEAPGARDFRQETAAILLKTYGGAEALLSTQSDLSDDMRHWLKILIGEGLSDAAETVALRYMLARTSVVQTWLAPASDPNASSPELEAYLRYLVLQRGSGNAVKIVQEALGVKPDGVAGPRLQATLTAAYQRDREGLMKRIKDIADQRLKSQSAPLPGSSKR
jgi:energy-coupling factor transporter ATP-binding protein EcfA2